MLLKLILVNCPNSTAFNTPSNAEMADKTRKTICKYIGTCFTTHLKFICCVFIV